ncbi:MAG: ligase-associated DNA damage response endonuclease PdeM [Marinoscillum sp.]
MKGKLELKGTEYEFDFREQHLVLSAEKALFWKEENALIITDLHLGKAGHFRKNGIPIPRQIHIADLQRVNSLIDHYQPGKIIFLGDLFHSDGNEEWLDFVTWSNYHHSIEQILVEGNHDILDKRAYSQTRMEIVPEYTVGPFGFTHETTKHKAYNISGHVHPCVRFRGLAHQGVRVPCFYFGADFALLPAFGEFTGSHPLRPTKNDLVFGIAEGQVIGLMA